MKPDFKEGESVLILTRPDGITWASVISVSPVAPYPVTVRVGRNVTIVDAARVTRPDAWQRRYTRDAA